MRERLRTALSDALFTFDLAVLTVWDMLLTMGEKVKRAAETTLGSTAIACVALVLAVWAATGIVFTHAPAFVLYLVLATCGYVVLLWNLPAARAARRRIREIEQEITESRVRAAESLGYFKGYDDGWHSGSRLARFYEGTAYHTMNGDGDDA